MSYYSSKTLHRQAQNEKYTVLLWAGFARLTNVDIRIIVVSLWNPTTRKTLVLLFLFLIIKPCKGTRLAALTRSELLSFAPLTFPLLKAVECSYCSVAQDYYLLVRTEFDEWTTTLSFPEPPLEAGGLGTKKAPKLV